jgi:hypothetical protein
MIGQSGAVKHNSGFKRDSARLPPSITRVCQYPPGSCNNSLERHAGLMVDQPNDRHMAVMATRQSSAPGSKGSHYGHSSLKAIPN